VKGGTETDGGGRGREADVKKGERWEEGNEWWKWEEGDTSVREEGKGKGGS